MLEKTKEGQFLKPTAFRTVQDDWSIYRMGDLEVRVRMIATSMGQLFGDPDGLIPHLNEDGTPGVSVTGKLMIAAQQIAGSSTEDESE